MELKSAAAVFGWILLGAVATGAGTGFFLYQANRDRADLIAQKQQAEARVNELISESNKLADEANEKLDHASREIQETEARLKALEQERELISQAEPLARTSLSSRWPEHLNVELGLGIRMPTQAEAIRNDAQSFTFRNRYANENAEPWLVIEPYSDAREKELIARLQTPSSINYLSQGRLLTGNRGGNGYALRIQMNASSTHLVWALTDRVFDETDLKQALATLSFR